MPSWAASSSKKERNWVSILSSFQSPHKSDLSKISTGKKRKLESNYFVGEALQPSLSSLISFSVHALRSRSGSCSTPRSETNHQPPFAVEDDVFGVDVGVGRRRSSSSSALSSHLNSARESPRIAALAAPGGESVARC
jgi:hypothetical protein